MLSPSWVPPQWREGETRVVRWSCAWLSGMGVRFELVPVGALSATSLTRRTMEFEWCAQWCVQFSHASCSLSLASL
eukprot:scaffold2335_cov135-Skeletonema_menzelii.AAC.7